MGSLRLNSASDFLSANRPNPLFNSNRNYNVLFKDESGAEVDSQIMAFDDTWHRAGAARALFFGAVMFSPVHRQKNCSMGII